MVALLLCSGSSAGTCPVSRAACSSHSGRVFQSPSAVLCHPGPLPRCSLGPWLSVEHRLFLVCAQASSWRSALAQSGRNCTMGRARGRALPTARGGHLEHCSQAPALCGGRLAYTGACPSDASYTGVQGPLQGPPQILWWLTFPCVSCSLFWGITALRMLPQEERAGRRYLLEPVVSPNSTLG